MGKSALWYVIDNFEKIFCAFLMSVLVLCLGLQVVMRYIFQDSLSWTEELSRYCFIALIYLGISLAAQKEQHVRVTAQYFLLPKAWRPYLWVISDLVWFIFNGIFIWQGILLVKHGFRFREISPALGWNAAYLYMVIPLGFTLMNLRILQVYRRALKNNNWRQVARIEGERE